MLDCLLLWVPCEVTYLTNCTTLTHTCACSRQGVWCVPHYEERWRTLSRLRFSIVHLRALRAGSKHRLVSWCSCHDSVAEALFDNQARCKHWPPCALSQQGCATPLLRKMRL